MKTLILNSLKLFFISFLVFSFPAMAAEVEPNESCEAANLLLDTAISTDSNYLSGTVDDNSDDDYFKIILTQRAELRLDKHDRNNKKTRAQVLESDCSISLGSTNSKDKTNWKFLLDAGTYYIRFYRSNADNAEYKIRAQMNRVADFIVSKSVNNAAPTVGDTITYTISTANNGPSGSQIHITDVLPTGLTFVSENQNGCSQSGNGLDCKKWLDSGATFEVDLEASINNGVSGLITNTVDVEKDTTNSNGDKTFESDLANNSANVNITVSASTAPPPVPTNETIPSTTTTDNSATCGTFEDGLQTRANNSTVSFSGGSGKLFNNPDAGLNTYTTPVNGGSGNDITCNDNLDGTADQSCSANGVGAMDITSFTMPYPVTYTFVSPFDTSSGDTIVVGTVAWGDDYNSGTPLEDFIYNVVSAHGGVSPNHLNFKATNLLKLGTLSTQVGNEVTFTSKTGDIFELQLKSVTTSTNNIFTANTKIKNIKMDTVAFGNDATISLKADQTIKINTLSTSHTTTLMIEAQYININTFTDISGSGQANTVTIKADYIDIGSFNVGDVTTLNIVPYTAGQKVVVKMNTFHTGSKNVINFKEGDYYIKTLDTQGSGNGYQWNMDVGNRVNLFLEDDYTTDSEIGINADTTGGSNLCSDSHSALDLFIFTKGNVTVKNDSRLVATIYSEQNVALNSASYIKGAISANDSITLGNATEVCYDQNIDSGGYGECSAVSFTCANPKEFTEVFKTSAHSKMIQAGNSSLCKRQGSSGTTCDPAGASRSSSNNAIYMINNDYDDVSGITDSSATTLNSSAAEIDIPAGKEVLWAGLFWQGYMVNKDDTFKEKGKSIKYKIEGAATYESVTNAEMNWVHFSSSRMYYQSFVDITTYVNSNGGGFYWVGDIATTEGTPTGGSYGAWSIAVVYRDKNEKLNNTTVFHGYKAFAGTTDINNAISYANTNSCNAANTGVGNSVSSTLSGFLTPKAGTVESSLIVFAGEGDTWGGSEYGYITDASNTRRNLSNGLNPNGNIMNATITRDNNYVRNGKPYYSDNSLGIDIDEYNLTGILNNNQTSTEITFTSGGDGYMPGMYALQTELRAPKLCYDYSYNQNGISFTEDNNGSKSPRIIGTVSTLSPVEVKLYVVNLEDALSTVTDMKMHITDINTTQAKYVSNTAIITRPNSVTQVNLNKAAPPFDEITDISVGPIDSLEYFYVYYDIDPQIADLNMSINASVDYNVTQPIGGGSFVTIPFSNVMLDEDIDMCVSTNTYNPTYSIFNVVHNDYYTWNGLSGERFYNLPTQITYREGNFQVIALDSNNTHELTDESTVVAVDMISADGFHITDIQCQDMTASISERVWVLFNDSNRSMFDRTALQSAISTGLTQLASTTDFYQNARHNTAFRIAYNTTNDGNDTLIQIEPTGSNYKILNFTELVQNISDCSSPVQMPSNPNNTTNKVAVACGNAGNQGISARQLRICNECVLGYNTHLICSRDNFSIRPEAFSIKVYDTNQTNVALQTEIDNSISDVTTTPSGNIIDLAAGYNYTIEVNATNYLNSTSSAGYIKTIDHILPNIAEYSWEPRNAHDISGCNDFNDSEIEFSFSDGSVSINQALNQVGEYRLSLRDTTWTDVDHTTEFMTHHVGSYFTNTDDCIENSDITRLINTVKGSPAPLNGCDISSTHNSSGTALKYRDYNLTFHPYSFDLSTIVPSYGVNNSALGATSFIYMADMAQDQNMSFHLNGDIRATGFNGNSVNNFVTSCYAEDLNLILDRSNISGNVAYQYRLNSGTVADNNNSLDIISLSEGNFTQDQNGSASTILNFNFARTPNQAQNPEELTFNNYDVSCNIPANCTFNADTDGVTVNSKSTDGTLAINQTLKHYYGRTHAPRQKFIDKTTPVNQNAFIFYEVYCEGVGCDKTLLQNGVGSTFSDDPRWFINTQHTVIDGNASNVTEKRASGIMSIITQPTGNSPDSVVVKYPGNSGYPYVTTMQNNASTWLIYNRFNASATQNEFPLEFYKDAGGYVGSGKSTNDVKVQHSNTLNSNENKSWW